MDPDVFVTIAFSGYAFVVVLGISAVLRATSHKNDTGSDDDAQSPIVEPCNASVRHR